MGDNNIGYVALLQSNKPVTQVCEKIVNSQLGKYLKTMITEIPEIPEEKGLSEKFQSAKTMMSIQDYESAIPVIVDEDKTNPNNFAVNFYLGLCYFQINKFDEAIQRWTKAVEISPKKYVVYRNLSKAYEKNGDRMMAAQMMQQYADLISVDPDMKQADVKTGFYDAGIYWWNVSVTEKYYAAFKKVLELDPANGDSWYYMGMYYFASQKNKECFDAMEKALLNNVSEENKATAIAIRDAVKTLQ
jgi:tetratricopeptide (TPR) repeat protein